MKTWYDEEEYKAMIDFEKSLGNVLWSAIRFPKREPSVTDYMKALKRAMGKKEKPVYNSALKAALKKPTWR